MAFASDPSAIEAVVHAQTQTLDRIVEGDDPDEVQQTCVFEHSFPGQIRVWCVIHIMWPRTLPFPVSRRRREEVISSRHLMSAQRG